MFMKRVSDFKKGTYNIPTELSNFIDAGTELIIAWFIFNSMAYLKAKTLPVHL